MKEKRKIFVGGPIQHAISSQGFLPHLKKTILSIAENLQIHGYLVYSAHLEEQFGKITHKFDTEEITLRDYHWMLDCDVFVAILPLSDQGSVIRTDGTHVELGWASALGKNIVLVSKIPLNSSHSFLVQGLKKVAHVCTIDIDQLEKNPNLLLKTIDAIL